MQNDIRAVFWDIDGTMVMSEPVHEGKTHYIASRYGITVTRAMQDSFYGTTDIAIHKFMQTLGMTCTFDEYMNDCIGYYRDNLQSIELRDGFMDAFDLFEQNGVIQSAVSNGVTPLVDFNIERTGLKDRLSVIVDVDYIIAQGLNPKPAADPYLEALRLVNEKSGLCIAPHQCLVVEDSPPGVRAGKAAGMNVIYWMLEPGKTRPEADYEAHTGQDLMDTIAPFFRKKLSA